MTRGGKEATKRPKEDDSVTRMRDAIAAGVITVYAPRRSTNAASTTATRTTTADEDALGTMTTMTSTTTTTTTQATTNVETGQDQSFYEDHDESKNNIDLSRTLIPQVSLTMDGEMEEEVNMGEKDENEALTPGEEHQPQPISESVLSDSEKNGAPFNSENELTQDSIDSGGTVIDVATAASSAATGKSGGVGKKSAENKPANLILPEDVQEEEEEMEEKEEEEGDSSSSKKRRKTAEDEEELNKLEASTPSNQRPLPLTAPQSATASLSTPVSPSFFFHYGPLASPSSLHPPPSPIPDIILPPRTESEMELAAELMGDLASLDGIGRTAADERLRSASTGFEDGRCESRESGDASCGGVYDETSEPRSDSYDPAELNSRSYGSQVTSGEDEVASLSADARSASGVVSVGSGVDQQQHHSQHNHQHHPPRGGSAGAGMVRSGSRMRSVSSFDHGCLSGRVSAHSAHSLGSFKHCHRTKGDEDALWADHMVRGGCSREDLAADNDISEFQEKLKEDMFTVEQIDFNEPLLDPAEKYHDLLWPKSNEDEDSDNKTISTCVDNPNLQMICRLKNEEQTVSLTLLDDRLEWVNHSVPSIPNGLKQQISLSAGPLLKIKLQTSSLSAYLMSCMIPLEDVITARTGMWTAHDKCIAKTDKIFTIFTLEKKPNNVWWYCTIHFECDTTVQSKVWAHTINRHIWLFLPKRPRCLLVFVNPICGKGNALLMYKKQIQPLLDLALIKAEVIISKGRKKNLTDSLHGFINVFPV